MSEQRDRGKQRDGERSRSNERLLDRQAERESNTRTYPRYIPMAIDRAEGVTLIDVEGNEYVDCLAGAGSIPLGHNHPAVVGPVRETLDRERPTHTLDLTTPEREAFLDTLLATFPPEFAENARVQFCSPAGTDAVEAALKLMRTATGNRDVLAFRGAYHGMTAGSLALMGDTAPREEVEVPGYVHHLPYPYEYRPPLGIGGEAEHRALAREVETALGLSTVIADRLVGRLVGVEVFRFASDVGVDHGRARVAERERHCATDARAAAGDDDRLPCEVAGNGSHYPFPLMPAD